jgi:hypothetical protein
MRAAYFPVVVNVVPQTGEGCQTRNLKLPVAGMRLGRTDLHASSDAMSRAVSHAAWVLGVVARRWTTNRQWKRYGSCWTTHRDDPATIQIQSKSELEARKTHVRVRQLHRQLAVHMEGFCTVGWRDLYDYQAICIVAAPGVSLRQHHDVKLCYSVAADFVVGDHTAGYVQLVVYRIDLLGQERPAYPHASQYAQILVRGSGIGLAHRDAAPHPSTRIAVSGRPSVLNCFRGPRPKGEAPGRRQSVDDEKPSATAHSGKSCRPVIGYPHNLSSWTISEFKSFRTAF